MAANAAAAVSASVPTPPIAPTPAPSIPTGPRAASERQTSKSTTPPVAPPVKEEPVDPLQMVADEEELEYEPDRLNLEVCFLDL